MISGSGRRPVVVGVDFGTLSGRAVVVRVADGAELGSAVHEYPHGVIEDALPGTGGGCRPTGRCRSRRTTVDVLRARGARRRSRPAGVAAERGRRHRHRLHRLHGAADARRRHAAVRAARVATARTPTSKLWKHHAAQAQADRINALAHERGEPWIGRYGGRISSEWEFAKGLQLLEEDPEVYAATERWVEAADWIVWQLCGRVRPQRLHRRLQGRSTRTGATRPGTSSARWTRGFAGFVDDKLDAPLGELGAAAGGLTAAGGRAGPGCPTASRWPSATSTPT